MCSYIRNTAIDFVDRLKCHGMHAKLIGYWLRVYQGSCQFVHEGNTMRNNNFVLLCICICICMYMYKYVITLCIYV